VGGNGFRVKAAKRNSLLLYGLDPLAIRRVEVLASGLPAAGWDILAEL